MASKDKSVKRGVELYIDGKEIKKDIASVEREFRKLTKELRSMEVGSAEYVATSKRIRELNGVLAEHKAGLKAVKNEHKSMVESMNDGLNKYMTAIGLAVAAIGAFFMSLNEYKKKLHEREDTKASVKALTGLDDESIKWLEDQAKILSTEMTKAGIRIRQSATDILNAFRLVGSAKPDLLQNKEALKEVAEQAMILAQAAGLDLKQAVDAVTLSMNQYGAASKEAARYANVMAAGSRFGSAAVEDVTIAVKKAGVAASSAGIPIEQLVGSIETLAEKGIKKEVAGTGLKSFFLRLEKQAEDVRPSVVGLQTALENLAKQNLSSSEMIKRFGLVGYTVAQAMISSAEKVESYTNKVTDTATATEQAGIMSQTAAAKLEQLKNKFAENGMILAEQLMPVFTHFMHWGSKFMQSLPIVIKYIKEYGAEMIILGSTILVMTTRVKIISAVTAAFNGVLAIINGTMAGYRTAMVLTSEAIAGCSLATTRLSTHLAAQNLLVRTATAFVTLFKTAYYALSLQFGLAKKSLEAFNVAMAKSGWGIAILAVGALTAAIYRHDKALKEAQKQWQEDARQKRKIQKDYDAMEKKINDLHDKLVDENVELKKRFAALNELQKIAPAYEAKLTKEGKLIDDNTTALKNYLAEFKKKIEYEAMEGKLKELYAQKYDLEDEVDDLNERYWDQRLTNTAQGIDRNSLPQKINRFFSRLLGDEHSEFGLESKLEEKRKELDKINSQIDNIESRVGKLKDDIGDDGVVVADEPDNPISHENIPEKESEKKKRLRLALLAIDAQYDKKAAEMKQAYIHGDIESEQEYTDKLAALELDRLKSKLEVAGLEEAQRADLLDKLMSEEIKLRKKLDSMVARQKELSYEEQLQALIDNFNDQEKFIEDAYDMGIIPTEERKNEYLLAITDNYRIQKMAILEKMAKEEDEIAKEREKAAAENAKKEREAYESEIEKFKSNAEDIADIFSEVGENIAEALWGEDKKKAWNDVWKDFLKDALSMVEKFILIKQSQIMAEAIASSSTIAGAAPAIAKAAAKMAGIKAAFAIARGGVDAFYTGGFTGAGRWDEPKGVVHAGEFVANRFATQNPQVLPVLSLIDAAQRAGSIKNLTGRDIASVAIGSSGSSMEQGSAALMKMIAELDKTLKMATQAYLTPSRAYCYVKGKGGIEEAQELANKLMKNATVK